jgi:hypothetical protein
MRELFTKLEQPVAVDLTATIDGTTADFAPANLPDLYRGEPIVVALRVPHGAADPARGTVELSGLYAGEPVVLSAKVGAMGGELHLSGTFDGKPWTAALRLADAVEGTGVAKLWARSKIASLEAKAYGDMNFGVVAKEIEAVALEHHLVSSQTSLIAIDKTKSRPDGQGVASVDMPVNLPDGWVYDKVFGPTGNPQHAKAAGQQYNRSGGGLFNSLMPSAVPQFSYDGGTDTAQESAPLPLDTAPPMPDRADTPDTSTVTADTPDMSTVLSDGPDASQADQSYPVLPLTVVPKPESLPLVSLKAQDASQRYFVLALVLALLSAVTVILWRYHRRDYASPRRIGRRI